MSATSHASQPVHGDHDEVPRRDFLAMLALAGAAVGAGAIVWPFIDSMEPAADTLAAGEPIDVDVSKVAPGQQIVVVWRGKPILIVHRTRIRRWISSRLMRRTGIARRCRRLR
jgi:ubiquinol-cytochrome c reductase iron-sulfur subunit